ncbi:ferric reductase like transmembrane component-domain-containing protein [Aspergillus aurantiobrunneus]
MRPLSYLSLTIYAASVSANILPVNERCVTSVYTAYGFITFAGSSSRKSWEPQCQNPLKVISIYASSDIFCRPAERVAGISNLEALCRGAGFDLLSRDRLAENLTEDAVKHMPTVEYLEVPLTEPIDYPVLLSPLYYRRVFQTIDTWAYTSWTHYAYGYVGYLYWGCILLIGMFHRTLQHFFISRYDHPSRAPSLLRYSPFRQAYHWVQTHFLVPTTIPSSGRQFLWWTFSTRSEAIVSLGFWVLSTVSCAIGYRLFPENIYWRETSAQLIRYMADRTGIISFANLPLVWLFAGRNNVCAWATGWNFATFNVFHRHVAWIATIQAVVHTILYLVLFFQNSNPWRKLRKPYLQWGTLATILMALILPAAVNWLRHRAYETFLLIHIIFSVGLLVGCFYHTIIFEGQEYWFYLWLPVGIWAFDRVLRVVRLFHCNLHVHIDSGHRIQYTTSTATYDKPADLIRLEVVPGSNSLQPHPGQYYFLYQPFRLTGWESHPFTLGCWSYKLGRRSSLPSTLTARKSNEQVDVSQIPLLSDDSSGSRSPDMQIPPTNSHELRLVFWIRPYDGWTRHLQQRCTQSPNQTTNTTMLLEGPYGHEFPLWSYESVLLIAGGTGIASAVPYIQDHIARSSTGEDSPKTRIHDINLIWVTRQPEFLYRLATRELSTALERDDFHASFYATSPLAPGQRDSPNLDPTAADLPRLTDKQIDVMKGRPNLEKTISTFAEEAHNSDSCAAVLVCGPPKMAEEARGAVHAAMRRGYSLRYVEESFSW